MSNQYDLKYTADIVNFIQGQDACIAKLRELDQLCDRLKPKLNSLTAGSATGVNALAKAIAALTAAAAPVSQLLANINGTASMLSGTMANVASNTQQTTAALNSLPEPANNVVSSFTKMYVGRMMLHEVMKVAEGITEALQKARDYARETAEENLKLYGSLREVANLRGKTTQEVGPEVLQFRMKTGTTGQEAEQFQSQYLGAIDAARVAYKVTAGEKGIKEQDIAGLGEHAATLAVRSGMDMETMGKMAGLLGQYHKIENAQQGAQMLGEITHHLNVEGVGKVSQLAKPFLGLAADMVEEGGRVGSLTDLSAIFSVATRQYRSGATAATGMRQANRLLRKMAVSDDAEVKAIGITPEDDFMTALAKAKPVLDRKDADLWLKGHGFGNVTEWASGMKFAQMYEQSGVAIQSREAKEKAQATVQANRNFLMGDIAGRTRVEEATLEAGEHIKGTEQQALESMRKGSKGELVAEGKIGTEKAGIMEEAGDWLLKRVGYESQRTIKENDRTRKRILTAMPELRKRYDEFKTVGEGENQEWATTVTSARLGAIVREIEPELAKAGVFQPNEGILKSLKAESVKAGANATKVGEGIPTPPGAPGAKGGDKTAMNDAALPKLDELITLTQETNVHLSKVSGGGTRSGARGGADLPDGTTEASNYRV